MGHLLGSRSQPVSTQTHVPRDTCVSIHLTAPGCACMNICIREHGLAHAHSWDSGSFHSWARAARRHKPCLILALTPIASLTALQRLKARDISPKVIAQLQSIGICPKASFERLSRGPRVHPVTASSRGRNQLSPVIYSKNKGNCRSGVGGAGWGCSTCGGICRARASPVLLRPGQFPQVSRCPSSQGVWSQDPHCVSCP